MTVSSSPIGGFAAQFFDNNGVILSGGKIYTYAAGTTTPQASYTSSSGATPHTNPIILDSAGRVPGGEIWLTDGLAYKFAIETATGSLLGTYDNISSIDAVSFAELAASTGATLIGTDTGATLAARLSQLSVKTFDSNGLGIVIGDESYSASAIGAGSILFGGWTASPNDNRLTGTVTNLRCIVGGYDNEIGAALASVIVGSHHSTISSSVTHGSIFGGSYNLIPAGNYGTIGGGTGNSVSADSATVAGGTTNSIAAGATSSTISGGSANAISASVLRGAISGGINNRITGGNNSAVVGGDGNTMSSGNSVVGGSSNTVTGANSFSFGLSNTVSVAYGAVWGRSNSVTKDYGAAWGYQAVARSTGRTAAGGQIAAVGDAQYTDLPIKGVTTSNTNVYLTGADANQFVIPFPSDNFAATVSALITAVEPATGASKSLRVDALVKRIGGVNTLVGGAATITVIAEDASAAAWTITGFSLSTNNMRIGVAGDVGKTVRWSGKVTAVEVSF